MQRLLLVAIVLGLAHAAQAQSARPRVEHRAFPISDLVEMTYAISIPSDYNGTEPRPLVLALHPGGARSAYYGSMNMRQIFEPALRDLGAIFIAPDAPTRRWTTDTADEAVMNLLEVVLGEYAIDRNRILITGFSLGGRGTWFMATRHPDFFTGAIPIAGSPPDDKLDALGDMPIHIIHSREDEVVPFGPAEATAQALKARQHSVRFTALDGIGHFAMGGYVDALRDAGIWMMEQWKERPSL